MFSIVIYYSVTDSLIASLELLLNWLNWLLFPLTETSITGLSPLGPKGATCWDTLYEACKIAVEVLDDIIAADGKKKYLDLTHKWWKGRYVCSYTT